MYCDNNEIKYYGNFDKNIKAIKGGGVITPSNPPNRQNQTGTVNNTWNNLITPTPPLYKNVYYSDKNLTNGYLNQNNYVVENNSISDYYYPSQKFDKVNNLTTKKNKKIKKEKILNDLNPIKIPPPLINSKYEINKQIIDNIDNNKIIDYIKNNTIYDGKYIYKIENESKDLYENNNTMNKFNNKITWFPFNNNLYKNSINKNDNNLFEIENFDTKEEKSNTILLLVFSLLLIFYFTIYQK